MEALIATRFSDAKQIGGTSTATQLEVCERYCRDNGFKVIGYHKVEAESAKSSNVARIAELLAFCRKYQSKAKILIVYKVDRFARDVGQHYYLKTELVKIGISLRSATEPIDDTPQGELMETILAGFAQFDNSVKKERVKLAMWARVSQGLWPWIPPLGYKPNRILGTKLTPHVLDDACFGIVKDMFNRYSTGLITMQELARELNKRKVKNYKGRVIKFSKQSIKYLLNNKYYIGLLTDKDGKTVAGKHTALIETSLYRKCQDIQLNLSNHTNQKRLYNNPDFPLRRFVVCGVCGKPLTACWAKSGRYPYYYCLNKVCSRSSKSIKKSDFEQWFVEYLKKVKPTEKTITRFKDRFMKRYILREQEIKGDYLRKLDEIQEMQKQLDWIVESGSKGNLPANIVKEKSTNLDGNITLAKLELAETYLEELDINALLTYAETFIRTLDFFWFDAQPYLKIMIQRSIFPKGVSFENNVFSNSRISPVFEIIEELGTEKDVNVTISIPDPNQLLNNLIDLFVAFGSEANQPAHIPLS